MIFVIASLFGFLIVAAHVATIEKFCRYAPEIGLRRGMNAMRVFFYLLFVATGFISLAGIWSRF